MAHNWSCAAAESPRCTCACGGASHGCQGAFKIAAGPAEGVREYVARRDQEWNAKPNRPQAAIGCAQADVVHWLHRDRKLLECTRAVQTAAFEDSPNSPTQGMVLRRVQKHLSDQQMEKFQEWAREAHFWCELLAQMAAAIAQYENVRGRMFALADGIRSPQDLSALPEELRRAGAIESAVHWAWRYVLSTVAAASGIGTVATVLAGGDMQPLLWPIRVIAVFMCPNATSHPAVRQHCWEPIAHHGSAEVRQEVRTRLTEAFPSDPWFAWNQRASGGL